MPLYFQKVIRSMPRIVLSLLIAIFIVTSHLILSDFVLKDHRVYAAFNKEINYQGKLTDSSGVAVPDGAYHMTFRLYTVPTGGTAIWEEDRSTDLGDRATVQNGLFSVLLGSSTPLTTVDFNQTLYLGVEVGGSAGSASWDGEMAPRKRLGAVPAAFEADRLDGLSSEQFLRSDAVNSTSTSSTFLTVAQSGSGNIADFIGQGSVNAMSILSSGYVGIGTTSPSARLTVWGDSASFGTLANFVNSASSSIVTILNNGNVGIGTSTPSSLFSVQGTSTSGMLANFVNSVNTPILSLFNDGRVGIGTESPLSFDVFKGLSVFGTGNVGYMMLSDGQFGDELGLLNENDDVIAVRMADGSYGYGGGLPGLTNLTVSATGNVGIGTTTPFAKLSVAGQTAADYFTAFSTTTASTFAYDIQTSGRLSISQSGTNAVIIGDISGNTRGTGALDVQSARSHASMVASGLSSVAFGTSNTAASNLAVAVGAGNNVQGLGSSAFGVGNTISGVYGLTVGNSNNIFADFESAVGYRNTTSGYGYAQAFGYNNTASAFYSSAFGLFNEIHNSNSRGSAFGFNNLITGSGYYGFGAGSNNVVYSEYESAVGYSNTTSNYGFAQAFGYMNSASGYQSSAFGVSNVIDASASRSSAFGVGNTSSGYRSSTFGSDNSASSDYAAAFGYGNTADNGFASSFGIQNIVTGETSSAFGYANSVSAGSASAFGSGVVNNITGSVQIGPSNAAKLTILGATGSVGYVGIGTATPSARLTVWGDSASTGRLANFVNSASTSVMTILNNGNVGVGTTTPWANLTVAGQTAADYYTGISTTATSTFGRGYFASGLAVGTDSPITTTFHSHGGNAMFSNAGVINLIIRDTSNSQIPTLTFQQGTNSRAAISAGTGLANRLNFLTAGSIRAYIDGNGNFGIGASVSPVSTLTVQGSLCVRNTGNCGTTAGTIYATNATVQGIDLAENYQTIDESLIAGEIVAVDENNPTFIKRAGQNDIVLGIVSTAPGFLLGADIDQSKPIALAGRVPVRVNGEGGAISIGDRIAVSSVDGVGMKASAGDETVAIALQSFDADDGIIEAFVDRRQAAAQVPLPVVDGGNNDKGTTKIISPEVALDASGNARSLGFAVPSGRNSATNISDLTEEDYSRYLDSIVGTNISTFRFKIDNQGENRLGILAGSAPAEILTASGEVDVYKLSVFTLAGVKAQQIRIETIEEKIKQIEESITDGSRLYESFEKFLDRLAGLGIRLSENLAHFTNLVAERFTVGSPQRPSGITIYDEKTGEPYCIKVVDGELKNLAGNCDEATDDKGSGLNGDDMSQTSPTVSDFPSEVDNEIKEDLDSSDIVDQAIEDGVTQVLEDGVELKNNSAEIEFIAEAVTVPLTDSGSVEVSEGSVGSLD